MKPVKGNAVVILDQKLYNSFIQEIITAASKFERLIEDPILKREVLLQLFHFLTENPSGSTPAPVYGTPKMHKFLSSGIFPKLRPIVSSMDVL